MSVDPIDKLQGYYETIIAELEAENAALWAFVRADDAVHGGTEDEKRVLRWRACELREALETFEEARP